MYWDTRSFSFTHLLLVVEGRITDSILECICLISKKYFVFKYFFIYIRIKNHRNQKYLRYIDSKNNIILAFLLILFFGEPLLYNGKPWEHLAPWQVPNTTGSLRYWMAGRWFRCCGWASHLKSSRTTPFFILNTFTL